MDAEPENPRSLPWPLFTIDFEASSLEARSYPIEVGVCLWRSPEHRIEGWSTLIRPTELWAEHGSWSPQSQEVHGIRREELDAGMTPADAVAALNAILGDHVAYCDGGASDLAWTRRLVLAAKTANAWRYGDVDALFARCDQSGYMRLVRWLDRTPARHRARDDAERLMKALARGFGLEHGTSIDIVIDPAATDPATRADFERLMAAKESARHADDEAVASGRVSPADMRVRNDWLREYDVAGARIMLDPPPEL